MDKILLALPALGCIVAMPLMMVVMMRMGGSKERNASSPGETAELRAQLEQLRGEFSQRDEIPR